MRNGGITLVWGPPRSGTTWLYNVVRLILERADIPSATWTFGQDLPTDRRPRALIVKSHHAHSMEFFTTHPLDTVRVVTILRDPTAAFQSLIRTQEADRAELIDWLRSDVASFEDALPHFPVAVACREEWIRDRSTEVIASIALVLGCPLEEVDVSYVADALSRDRVRDTVRELRSQHGWAEDFGKYDRDTQWHANHIAPDDYTPPQVSPDEAVALAAIRESVEAITTGYPLTGEIPALGPQDIDSGLPASYLAFLAEGQRRGLLSRILGRR